MSLSILVKNSVISYIWWSDDFGNVITVYLTSTTSSGPPFLVSFFAGAVFPFCYAACLDNSSFYFLLILGSFNNYISSASNYSPLSFLS